MIAIAKKALVSLFNPRGKFVVEHFDRFGLFKGRYEFPNGITDEGKDKILDDMFNDGVQTANASWFIGLIDLSGFSALADADTMGSHGGWNEFTSYSEANRVAWGSGAASSESTTNSSPATFNISGSGTVKGVLVPTNNTKGGTSGTLWATALFAADVPVSNGDQLKVTYTVSA
ncbi:hypothetical protein LCGC14_1175730 [marine sediment metagenome]|uniref:Uncharacterized protein n=1 Tax=marine sediment metagenome TaxID=412755 RepID=A0A0F9LNL1_9ZZZZ